MAALPVGSTPYSSSYGPSTSSSSSPAIGAGTSSTQPSGRGISLANNRAAQRELVQIISERSLSEESQKLRAELRALYFRPTKLTPEAQRLVDRVNMRGGKLTDTIVSDLTATTAGRLNQDVSIAVSEDQKRYQACDCLNNFQLLFVSLINLKNAPKTPENIQRIKELEENLKKILGEVKELLATNVNFMSMGVDLHEMLYDGKLLLKDKQDEIPQTNGQYCNAYERTAADLLENYQNRYEAILDAWGNREVADNFDDELEDLDHLLESLEMFQNLPSYCCIRHKFTPELPALIMKLYENIKDFIGEMKPVINSINKGTSPSHLCTFNILISTTDLVTRTETTKTVTWKMFKGQNFSDIYRSLKNQFGEGTFVLSDGRRSNLLKDYPGLITSSLENQELILKYIYGDLKLPISFIPDDPNHAKRRASRVVVANYRNNLRTSSAIHATAMFHPASSVTTTAVYRPSPATPPPVNIGHSLPPGYSSASSVTTTAVYRPSPATPPPVNIRHSLRPGYSSASSVTSTAVHKPSPATPPLAQTGHVLSPAYSSASSVTTTAVYRPLPVTPPSAHTGHGLPPAYSSASSVTATTRSLLPSVTSSLAYAGHTSPPPAYNLASFLTSTADSSTSAALQPTHTGHIQTRPLSSHTWTPINHQSGQGAVASSMRIPVSHPSVTATLPSTSSFRSTAVPPAATTAVTISIPQAQSSHEETEDVTHLFTSYKV